MTLAEIKAAERRRSFLADLDSMANRTYNQFKGKYLTYCKIMGYDPDNVCFDKSIDDEILNGIVGVLGNTALIMDWTNIEQ